MKLFPEPCPICGKIFKKNKASQKTCSFACGVLQRANPKVSDPEVSEMYLSGMAQLEIAASIGVSLKSVQKSLRRSNVKMRKAAKRDQRGPKNDSWVGDSISYKGAHDRVRLYRGDPDKCSQCGIGSKEAKLEWANMNKKYHDPDDYTALCVPCHRKMDAERRKATNG